jgi:autotransporter-associated beta strand protein
LTLSAANTYAGGTLINNGTLALTSTGSLSNSAQLSLVAGTTLDVSAINSYSLGNKTTLSAAGTSTAASINGASGGTVNLGSQSITLTYDGSHPALVISQGTLVLNGNAFTVNASSPLSAGIYPVVQQAGGSINASGSFTATGTAIGSGTSGSISVSGGSVNLIVTGTCGFSNLTANQAAGYGAASILLTGTVSGGGPVYPAIGETVTVTINGNQQAATIYDSTGDFSLNYDLSTIPASATPYTIAYAYAGNAYLLAASDTSSTLTVSATSLALTVSASGINYGQSLASSSLAGSVATIGTSGTPVAGSFAFATPDIIPNAGTTNVSVIFTPADTNDYNVATATVAVSVDKDTPTVTAPTASAIIFGQALTSSSLTGGAATNANNGATVAGSFAFTTPSIVPNVGTTNVSVTFTPSDTTNYNAATVTVAVVVNIPTGVALQWDANSATPVAQDGDGIWNTIGTNWLYNSNNIAWTDHNVAVFGINTATNCVVTLANDVTPMGITFNATHGMYTIAGSNNIWTTGGLNIVEYTNATIAASLSGTGGLTNNGPAILTLSGTNSYTGLTTVNAGTVNVNGDQSAATGGWLLTNGAASANFNAGSKIVVAVNKSIVMGGNGSTGNTLAVAGTVTNDGTLTVGRRVNLNLNNGASWTQNNGMIVAPTPNTGYSANMTVNAGATFICTGPSTNGVSPSTGSSGSGVLTIAGGTFVTRQGFINNATNSTGTGIIAFSGNGTLRLTANITSLYVNPWGSANSITLGAGGGVIDTAGFSTTLRTVISSNGTLTKLGSGTLTLSAANTYTGGTFINNGILALASTGSINNSAQLSLAAGTTLNVSAINSYLLGSNTTLSAAGTSTAATINGAAGGTVSLDSRPITLTYDGSHPALVISQGTLVLNGNTFTVNASSPLPAGIYPVIQQAGGSINSSGTFTVTGTAIGSGMSGSISVSGANVNLIVTEPSGFSNLTANQIVGYGMTSVLLTGTVSGSGPVYPAIGETVTVTINGNQQAATIYDSTGDFSLNYDLSTIPASATPYAITYAYAGNAYLMAASDTSSTLTVIKANLGLAVPASGIIYGQSLASSSLVSSVATNMISGAPVAGSFTFTMPGIVANAGTTNVSVTFTPADTDDYNIATTIVTVTVDKATPTITAPTASAIAFGQTLASSSLTGGVAINENNGVAVAGSFAFTTPTILPDAGTTNVSVTFTPADTNNYDAATANVLVTVDKSTPMLTAPTASTIAYGQTLTSSTLTGGAATNANNGVAVAGSFAFTTPTIAPNAGTTNVSVTFTPADTNDYNPATVIVTLAVGQATPIVTAPTASAITYGQTLASSALTGGAATNANNGVVVAGSFAFTTPTIMPNAGTTNVSVTFTPADTNDYSPATVIVTLAVDQATPILTAPTASAIIYGQTLASSTLTGGGATNVNNSVAVAGSFAFTTPTIVPNAGATNVSVTFTPADTNDYSPATVIVTLGVGQATPILAAPTASGVTYGQTLASSTLTGGAATNANNGVAVAGSFAFTTPTIMPNAGTTNVSVTFTPSDTNDYSTATTTVEVSVGKGTPTLTVPTASALAYGQTLTASTLTGGAATNANNGAAVAGSFAFTTPTIAPNAGMTNVSITFTPADTNDYNTATVTVAVSVGKSTPMLTVPAASVITYGQTLASSALTGGAATNANNGAAVAGSFAFTTPTTAPTAGTTNVSVTFTPADTNDYNPTTATVAVTVGKSIPTLAAPTASAIVYGQTLALSTLSGGAASNANNGVAVAGSFAFTTPTIAPNAGATNVSVTFAPADTNNYNTAIITVAVSVGKGTPTLAVPTASAIAYGQALSSSALTGGAATNVNNGVAVAGGFAFTTPTIVPNAGTTNVSVTFTPADTKNYNLATTTVAVSVGKSTPALTVPKASTIIYGQTLAVSTLTGGAATNANNGTAVAGSFTFTTQSIAPNAGITNVSITFTPNDVKNYNIATTEMAVVVGQATPTLTAPTASMIIYGQTLASSTLTGGAATNAINGAAVAGSFAFTTPTIIPNVGITNVSVTFSPADAIDFTNATTLVTVKVIPVGTALQWDANTSISGAQDGRGTWSATTTNWLYGGNNLGWFDNNVAVFGFNTTTNCVVTLANDVTPAGITFNATKGTYTIAGTNAIWTTDGLNIDVNSNAVISALITGSGGLTNRGSGTLTLSGTDNYTGGTTVDAGTVNVFGDQSAAVGGWTLASGSNGVGMTVNFNADSTVAVASTNSISLHNTMTGNFANATVNVAGTVTDNGTLDVNRLGALTLNSGANWTQNGGLFIRTTSSTSGGSIMTVSNNATFTYSGSGAIGISPSSGSLGSAKLIISGGTFTTSQGFQNATAASAGNATITLTNGGTLALSTNIAQLTIGNAANTYISTGDGSVGGAIDTSVFGATISNIVTGSGSLTKLGSGTLTLSASNNYTGSTTISNGMLCVNGYIGTGAVMVASGSVLSGTGTVGGAVTVNGTVAPGSNGVGTLNTGSETWNGGGGYQFSLNNTAKSSGWDSLNINGPLNIQADAYSPFTIKLVSLTSSNTPGLLAGFNSNGTYNWTLSTASGGIQSYNPWRFVVDTTSFSNAFTGTFSVSKSGGSLVLTYSTKNNSSVVAAPQQPVVVGQTAILNDGTFGFTFSGTAGQSYHVYSSTNLALPLADWSVATNGVFGTAPVNYSESTANNAQKFYQVVSP